MRVLDSSTYLEAHQANFNPTVRKSSDIKYIVIHYTGNIGDTARNNAIYFRSNAVQSSAHYFVSETSIYQSVPDNHAAYAVGLGSRKEPYFKYPTMWKTVTNSNSISIEICGSRNSREGSNETKETAAKLAADLMEKYSISLDCVCRHYDVTGKSCPAWAVTDPLNWLDFRLMISNAFYGKEVDDMTDTTENYAVFKTWMERYEDEKAAIAPTWEKEAMDYCAARGLISDGRPRSTVTRGELATVLMRLNG